MKITNSTVLMLVNAHGKVFEGTFVGSIEYVTRCSPMGGGEYDIDLDYAAAFKLTTGEVIAVDAVKATDKATKFNTWSLKGGWSDILWTIYPDWVDKNYKEYCADIELDRLTSGSIVAIETDQLPF